MSNGIIMWSMFFIPWLSLFFMKKEEVKHWMPVAMFAVVLTTIIHDVGTTLGFWATRESTFPFYEMMPYYYGFMPVLTLWVFKFTYGRFWGYLITNTILDIGFNFFLLSYFLPSIGIFDFNISPVLSLPITLTHAIVIYGYQIWQDDIFLRAKNMINNNLQPAAAKPLSNQLEAEKKD
ncbi:hypothetical protein [Pelorhabdus rhamnosifermentans]|uniref:hypothetical protein n=1 Tax=Pelorhabdus rhamnosifermentans TaxID=2772457 RepID=UPI001C0606E7|nr:hypothetical protein [Pelorhabdus rhamnosifermentans]